MDDAWIAVEGADASAKTSQSALEKKKYGWDKIYADASVCKTDGTGCKDGDGVYTTWNSEKSAISALTG